MPTKTTKTQKGTSVQVQEGSSQQDPVTAEFVRRGMQSFADVNQSLLRMQQEIQQLAGRPPSIGIQTIPYPVQAPFLTPQALQAAALQGIRLQAAGLLPSQQALLAAGVQSPFAPNVSALAGQAPWAAYANPNVASPLANQLASQAGLAQAGIGLDPTVQHIAHLVAQQTALQSSVLGQAPQIPQSAQAPLAHAPYAANAAGLPVQQQASQGFLPASMPFASHGYGVQAPLGMAGLSGAYLSQGNAGFDPTGFAAFSGAGVPQAYPSQGAIGGWGAPQAFASGNPASIPYGSAGTSQFMAAPQRTGFRPVGDLRDAPPQQRTPVADLIDEGDGYQVRLELPGVKKDDLDITCYANCVVVTARSNVDFDEGALLVGESGNTVYRRTIDLPSEIKTGECEARLQDGVLNLNLVKLVPTEGPRHLDVAYR